jgi:hypothetical protein
VSAGWKRAVAMRANSGGAGLSVTALIKQAEQAAAERAQNIAPVRLDDQLARLAEKWGGKMVRP